ncbi:MAG: HDOD domain-containing protein [Granulosicoccus sp.]
MIDQQELELLISKRLEAGEVELPVFDDIALRINREVRENKLDADLICQIIEEDLALVAELLKMANSAFFAGMSPVGSLKEAAVRLGVRQIASIVFSVSQKRLYSASSGLFKSRLTRLWEHTSAVSLGSRWLAANAGFRRLADEAFVSGLLHDIGKLSLLCILEEIIAKEGLEISDEIVDATLLSMNCEHGEYLLESWNLPEEYKTIVRNQNAEELDPSNTVLAIIRLVDKVCIVEGIADMDYEEDFDIVNMKEVQALSLCEEDLSELSLILQEAKGGETSKAA